MPTAQTLIRPKIRALLLEASDGMTVVELEQRIGVDHGQISRALNGMPDVYIDRWFPRGPKRSSPVWCAVMVPANCPKPATKLPTRSQSRYRAFLNAQSGMSFKEWMRARP